ncbi:MAG: carboxymuconolactone decarboxylase family protein [Candidatus Thorarchaeota archaeon]
MDKIDKDKIEKIDNDREKVHQILLKKGSAVYKSFLDLERHTFSDDELKKVYKELIALGISIGINCESYIEWHIKVALNSGTIEKQTIENI